MIAWSNCGCRIPGATFEVVADSGHMMMSEAPGEVTQALRGFLDRVKRGGTSSGA